MIVIDKMCYLDLSRDSNDFDRQGEIEDVIIIQGGNDNKKIGKEKRFQVMPIRDSRNKEDEDEEGELDIYFSTFAIVMFTIECSLVSFN